MADRESFAIRTYRYLRIAMVGLVVLLAVSVAIEWSKAGRTCLQTSISAYYYTPVQAIFVGALLAIGTCLIAVKGNTPLEDIALNLAGMFAPVVALVPTSGQGSCMSVPFVLRDAAPNIDNNYLALAITGAIAAVATAVISGRSGRLNAATAKKFHRGDRVGLLVAAAVMTGGLVWYLWLPGFMTHAHSYTAIGMFVCLGIAAATNAFADRVGQPIADRYRRIYLAVLIGMIVAAVVVVVAATVFKFGHAIFALEAAAIALFATFWSAQTAEHWHGGLRPTRPD